MNAEERLEQVLAQHRELGRQMARLDLEIASILHELRGRNPGNEASPLYEVSPHLVMPYLQQAKLDTLRPQNRR